MAAQMQDDYRPVIAEILADVAMQLPYEDEADTHATRLIEGANTLRWCAEYEGTARGSEVDELAALREQAEQLVALIEETSKIQGTARLTPAKFLGAVKDLVMP